LTITADDVVIDGNGKTITYGTGGTNNNYGVYVLGKNNLTLKNSNISEGRLTGENKSAVYIYNSDYSVIQNNNFTTIGTRSYGVHMVGGDNNLFSANKINSSGTFGYAVYTSGSMSNDVFDLNTITASGTGVPAMYFLASSYNNTIRSSIIRGVDGNAGIVFSGGSSYDSLIGNTIRGEGGSGMGIQCLSLSYAKIISNNIYGAGYYGLGISGYASGNVISGNYISGTNYAAISAAGSSNNIINGSNSFSVLGSSCYNSCAGISIFGTSTNDIIRGNSFHISPINGRDFYLTPINLSLIDQKIAGYAITSSGASSINFIDSREGAITLFNLGTFGATNLIGTSISDIRISTNSAYINPSISAFNRNANITLYGISFVPTTVLKNGVQCGVSCSSVISFGNNKYGFETSGSGNYSLSR